MTDMGEVREAAPRSRRSGPGLEIAIQAAVLELLATSGYEAMTMEQIATCAGTGKAALYRRWQTKSDLVLDTLEAFVDLEWPLPDTGGLREDLIEALALVAESMEDPLARGAAAALAELPGAPTRRSGLRKRMLAARSKALLDIIERAVRRGEVSRVPPPVVADAALALLVYRLLVDGLPLSRAALEEAVDGIVMPLVGDPAPPSA